jgi:DNA polymerase
MGFSYIDPFNVNTKTPSFPTQDTLESLTKNIASCHLCDLSKSRTQSMSGYGSLDADVMIIDHFVSQAQDSTNSYYSGRSGEMLKNMIEKVMHLSVEDVFLTHTLKCKPLSTNKPSPSEWNSCKSYLFAQIDFIQPKVIVTLGEEAYTKLTQDFNNFENVRGHLIDFQGTKLVPIYHPLYLFRNPELKKTTMNDLKTIISCF